MYGNMCYSSTALVIYRRNNNSYLCLNTHIEDEDFIGVEPHVTFEPQGSQSVHISAIVLTSGLCNYYM